MFGLVVAVLGLSQFAGASPCTAKKQKIQVHYQSFERCVKTANHGKAIESTACAAELKALVSAGTAYARCSSAKDQKDGTKTVEGMTSGCADCSPCNSARLKAEDHLLNCARGWRSVEGLVDLPADDCETARTDFIKSSACSSAQWKAEAWVQFMDGVKVEEGVPNVTYAAGQEHYPAVAADRATAEANAMAKCRKGAQKYKKIVQECEISFSRVLTEGDKAN